MAIDGRALPTRSRSAGGRSGSYGPTVAGVLASLAWIAARPRDRWHARRARRARPVRVDAASALSPASSSRLPRWPRSSSCSRALRAFRPPTRSHGALGRGGRRRRCGCVTAPIVWLHFGAVALWTVPANVAAEPAMPPLIALSLAAAGLEPVLPDAAAALAWLAGGAPPGSPSSRGSSPAGRRPVESPVAPARPRRRGARRCRRPPAPALPASHRDVSRCSSAALCLATVACALRPTPDVDAAGRPAGDVPRRRTGRRCARRGARCDRCSSTRGPPEADVAGQLRAPGSVR